MGHRLSKIYTRTGDTGTTGLGDGNRIDKDHPRMEAIGAVDELNSLIGVLAAETGDTGIVELLTAVQHDLFDLGGELSIPGHRLIGSERNSWLESEIDRLNQPLPPLKNFILPGGSRTASFCHLARAVCRRCERCLVTLARGDAINTEARVYLNRLSDLLFVLARTLARANGGGEVLWQQRR